MKKHTWEFFAEVWTATLIRRVANRLKLHTDTVGAWKRPVPSDEFPSGSGKANLLDHFLFLLAEIHKSFPGVAREIAEFILAFVNRLDREDGSNSAADNASPCDKLADSVKEHSDVVILLAARPNDAEAWKKARKEIRESVAALMALDGCLESLIETEEKQK